MKQSALERLKTSQIKLNENNPRIIKDDKFRKLVKSLKDFPEMLELRPIIIDENNMVLGGNMRTLAAKTLGLKDLPVIRANNLTEEQKQEFVIKDNINFGDWDWDIVANLYEQNTIEDWGVEVVGWNQTFVPEFNPSFTADEVTQQEVEKRAQEMAKEIVKTLQLKSVICPSCEYEFEIS